MRILALLAVVSAAATATASASDLVYQGRATDTLGAPVNDDDATISVTLLDGSGNTITTVSFSNVNIQDGYFSVVLSVPDAQLAQAEEVELAVNGSTLSPTQPISTTPRAASIPTPQNIGIKDNGSGVHLWNDDTHARSCEEYRRPPGGYAYDGDIGDGTYRIDPDGAGTGTVAAYDILCLMSEHGGGWSRVLNLTSGSATGSIYGVAPATERVDLGDWNFSLDLFRLSDREVLIRENISPFRTHKYKMDLYCDVTDYQFIGLVTGDEKPNCVGVWNWTDHIYVSQTDGSCNTNNHSQWNCTPSTGIRFHYGSRDYTGDGGSAPPDPGHSWSWFTGYGSGYGDYSKLVLNWDGNYNAKPHSIYVR